MPSITEVRNDLTGNTITKLQEMHLTVMANALKEQLSDANEFAQFESKLVFLWIENGTSQEQPVFSEKDSSEMPVYLIRMLALKT